MIKQIFNTSRVIGQVCFFAFAVFLFLSTNVEAATLQLNPGSGSFSSGQTFTAAVRVQPAGAKINAVEATLKFDPTALSVVSVNRDGSVFSLWTVEPSFSNSAGTVTFGGGSPTPFSTASNLINVTFRTLKEGSASVNFSAASVLAADGQGTNVFQSSPAANFTVAPAPAPTPTPSPIPTPTQPSTPNSSSGALIFGDPPRAPEVGSTAFIDSEVWYKSNEGIFTWTLPFDVNALAIEISTSSENVPNLNREAIYEPPIDEFRITKDMLIDGIQYFSIRFKNQVDWGVTLNRKLQIDATPPLPFDIDIRVGTTPSSFPLLVFEARDETSGVAYYELTIADQEPFRVTPDEARLGYLLRDLEDGTYTVKVVAYDKAGNMRESSKPVLITAGWIKPVATEEVKSFWDFFTAINLLIFFLIVVIILQLIYIWYERNQIKIKEEKLRRETREVQDQMEKIFSALRDEIYDQVNMITKRKRLSKSEREAVEGLNQALEVSETLIEKEINDVKAILK
ncbi:MAG TPA: cohesin domain-containing protein [Candidatus Paceibacterota bacterium]|nr:cohesin domain-containing protein [Candidatus Paceibacterota bacterium]